MILALDDDMPDAVEEAIREPRGGHRAVDHPPRAASADDDAGSLIPDGLDATLVLVRHGESKFIVEGRFQGQADTPLTGARAAPGGARRRPARRARTSDRPCRSRTAPPLEIVHSPLARTRGATAEAIAAAGAIAGRSAPDAGLPRDRPGRVGGPPSRRDRGALRARSWGPGGAARPRRWAPGGESLADGRRAGPSGARARCSPTSPTAGVAGHP